MCFSVPVHASLPAPKVCVGVPICIYCVFVCVCVCGRGGERRVRGAVGIAGRCGHRQCQGRSRRPPPQAGGGAGLRKHELHVTAAS